MREALSCAMLQRDMLQAEKAEVAEALTKVGPHLPPSYKRTSDPRSQVIPVWPQTDPWLTSEPGHRLAPLWTGLTFDPAHRRTSLSGRVPAFPDAPGGSTRQRSCVCGSWGHGPEGSQWEPAPFSAPRALRGTVLRPHSGNPQSVACAAPLAGFSSPQLCRVQLLLSVLTGHSSSLCRDFPALGHLPPPSYTIPRSISLHRSLSLPIIVSAPSWL